MNELAVVVKSIGQSMIHTVQIALRSMDSTVKARETMVFHSVHKPQTALAEQLPFSAMNPPRLVNSSKSSFEDDRDLESLQSLSTIDSTESVHSSASSTSPLSNTSASLPVATSENTPGASQEPNKCRLYHESSKDNRFVIALGMLLAMNSGFNNGVTLSGFLTPFNSVWDREETGGTTGAITKSALALADSSEEVFDEPHWSYFGFTMGIILSFMAGGVISAILNPRPVAWKLSPTYLPAFFIGSCFMVAGAGMAHLEKTEARPGTVCFYFYFIAAANGLANSLSSTFSGNLLR